MRRNKAPEPDTSGRWMISYADFVTLLLVFFIIMYSMSNVSVEKYKALAESLSGAMGGGTGQGGGGGGAGGGLPDESELPDPEDMPSAENLGASGLSTEEEGQMTEIMEELETYFEEEDLDQYVSMHVDKKGLVITLNDMILFDSAKAEVKADMVDLVLKLGETLSKIDNFIRIEGHTDNLPLRNPEYKSNWELSSARSNNVLHIFIDRCNIAPERLSGVGYGEFRPVANNDNEDGRSKNRRVNIIVQSSKFDDLESTN